jgi:hypothetical protein
VRKEAADYIGGRGGKGSELREERSRRALRRTVKEGVRVRVNKTIDCGDGSCSVRDRELCEVFRRDKKRVLSNAESALAK